MNDKSENYEHVLGLAREIQNDKNLQYGFAMINSNITVCIKNGNGSYKVNPIKNECADEKLAINMADELYMDLLRNYGKPITNCEIDDTMAIFLKKSRPINFDEIARKTIDIAAQRKKERLKNQETL